MLPCCASKRDNEATAATSEHQNASGHFRSTRQGNTPLPRTITPGATTSAVTPGTTSGSSSSLRRGTVSEDMHAFSTIDTDGIDMDAIDNGFDTDDSRILASPSGVLSPSEDGGEGADSVVKNSINNVAARSLMVDQKMNYDSKSGDDHIPSDDQKSELSTSRSSAIKIQARHRGRSARKKAAAEKRSVVKIQAQARGRSTRKKSRFPSLFRRKSKDTKTEENMDVEESMAAPAAATEETMATATVAAVAKPDADAFDLHRWREHLLLSRLLCPQKHALEAHSSKYEWICNRCHAHQALGTLVYTCHHDNPGTDPCDYDVCEACCKSVPPTAPPPPQQPPPEEGDPAFHEEGPPHLRCPNRHSLHKQISLYEWNCNRCKSVQKVPENVKSFVYTCWLGAGHEDPCDYHVCEDCCMGNPSEYDHPALTPSSHDEDGHYYLL